jgi:phosphoenolpyruvate---glycerone phosphotransferase subunit DhaM
MIHIVLVSHSHKLAAGLAELVRFMGPPDVTVAPVGGIEDLHGDIHFGTNALAIVNAIQSNPDAEGVIILVDLGSAVLSAETAVDMLEPELQARCIISNAPLVEGAIIASIEAGLDRTLAEINEAAEGVVRVAKVLPRA